jgi:Family of unknown function (DUF5331)
MNTEQLRQSLKAKWLDYYCENRSWLVRLGVWIDSEGQRRPSSSFILATLSVLEPDLTQLLPLIVDLSSSPDRIVRALGLNFSPDRELGTIPESEAGLGEPIRMLPSGKASEVKLKSPSYAKHPAAIADESCRGIETNDATQNLQE